MQLKYYVLCSESEDDWPIKVKDAILEKCGPRHDMVHIHVDITSKEVSYFIDKSSLMCYIMRQSCVSAVFRDVFMWSAARKTLQVRRSGSSMEVGLTVRIWQYFHVADF